MAFGYLLLLSGVALLVFWGVQVRYGDISDLDPTSFLVRWFAPKKPGCASVAQSGSSSLVVAYPLAAGVLVATVMCFTSPAARSFPLSVGYFAPVQQQGASSPGSPVTAKFLGNHADAD